ncbi:hypothetical protein BKA69DRAFT_178275 [Paraphysoderma sedebokerense]|nr:hypothetical protein BKA69DRAFT_178275 [Paraphysoderma sedebokerense]
MSFRWNYTVSGHGSTNENHEGNANGVVHTNLSKQNLAFMDVIRNKSGPSKAFHRKIKIRHPKSGEEKGLNEWMDDPAALLEILDLDLELRKKLHKSVATGKMKKYFNDSEQEVVRDWITQFNDIDIHSAICPRHDNFLSKNTPSRSYPLLRELSMMHVTDAECQQIFSNMMNCISNTPKTYGVVHDVSTIEKIITTAFLLPSCLDGIGGVQIHTSHLGMVLHNIKRLLVCSNGSSNNETANWWDLWEKVSKDHRYSLKRDTSSYRFEEELHRVIKSLTIRPIQYQYFIFGFFMHLFHQIRFVVLRAGFDSKNFIVERDEIMIMLENIRRTVINAIGKHSRDEVINVVDTGMGWLLAEHLYEMENISFFEE